MQRPNRRRFREERVIGFLASIVCLAGAGYSFWTSHDVIVFLVLIGVATGQIAIWDAIGRVGRRQTNTRQAGNGKEDATEEE